MRPPPRPASELGSLAGGARPASRAAPGAFAMRVLTSTSARREAASVSNRTTVKLGAGPASPTPYRRMPDRDSRRPDRKYRTRMQPSRCRRGSQAAKDAPWRLWQERHQCVGSGGAVRRMRTRLRLPYARRASGREKAAPLGESGGSVRIAVVTGGQGAPRGKWNRTRFA